MAKAAVPTAGPSLASRLDRERTVLDQLISNAEAGHRRQSDYDADEELAQSVARGIIAAFRSRPDR